jgi:hypothetical protein
MPYAALTVLLVISAALSSCATQPAPNAIDPPGFWSGLLHGFTIFFSLIWSIFSDNRIYAFPNSGGWYDLGYFWGAAAFLSGSGAASRRPAPQQIAGPVA